MHFCLTLVTGQCPNPFSTNRSTVSPYLINPQSLPPHRFGLSIQWLIFLRALSLPPNPREHPWPGMMSPAERTGSSVTCPVLAPPITERLGLTRAGDPGAGYAAVPAGRVTWQDPPGSQRDPQTVPERGSAAARGAPWSWSTRGPTVKASAGGAGEVRAAGQRALGLVARGREQQREGKGSRRLPDLATTHYEAPRPPAPPSSHTPSHFAQSTGPKELVKFQFLKVFMLRAPRYLSSRLQEARGSVLTRSDLGPRLAPAVQMHQPC